MATNGSVREGGYLFLLSFAILWVLDKNINVNGVARSRLIRYHRWKGLNRELYVAIMK